MQMVVSILTSLLTGVYSGLVVVKYAEFRSLREDAIRATITRATARDQADEIFLISESLSRLKHRRSAIRLREISSAYRNFAPSSAIFGDDGSVSLPSPNEAVKILDRQEELRVAIRSLSPSWFNIAFPF